MKLVRESFKVLFLVCVSILIAGNAYAYDYLKCRRATGVGNGGGLFLSTTSYVSSTGPCAMIGKAEHDRKVFYAANFDKMLDNFAKGSGEYAMTFARLSGCNESGQKNYPALMKKNFSVLLNSHVTEESEKTFEKLLHFLSTEPGLAKKCSLNKA